MPHWSFTLILTVIMHTLSSQPHGGWGGGGMDVKIEDRENLTIRYRRRCLLTFALLYVLQYAESRLSSLSQVYAFRVKTPPKDAMSTYLSARANPVCHESL